LTVLNSRKESIESIKAHVVNTPSEKCQQVGGL